MKKLFIFFAALTAMPLSLQAQKFSAKNDDGVRIYYNITDADDKTVEVTKRSKGEYSGVVNIPNSVSYRANTYSVTEIGKEAFIGCTSINSLTIPNTITAIGEKAFAGCTSLSAITIPKSVTEIGSHAFNSCYSFKSITIPNSITEIEEGTLAHCTSLNSITIPNSVTKILKNAFTYCTALKTITIPSSVKEIGDVAFAGCTSLSSIIFNADSCADFGYQHSSFFNCPITAVTIGDNVTRIPAYFMSEQTMLSSITIPNSVKEIGGYMLGGCKNIKSVYVMAITPPKIKGGLFYDEDMDKPAPIYVQMSSVDKYKDAEVWKGLNITGYDFPVSVGNTK